MLSPAGLLAICLAIGKFSLKFATNVLSAMALGLPSVSMPGTGDTTFFGDGLGGGGPKLNPLPVPECCPLGRDLGATLVLTLIGATDDGPVDEAGW